MDRLREEKIQKFEEFVDRRLKPDLVRAIAERDKVFEQQKVLYPSVTPLMFSLLKYAAQFVYNHCSIP
ncbi:hypothetical protein Hanom_Chr17g01531761 [Helianthus anomalus]